MADPKSPPKADPKDPAENRFVQDGDEGITINGMTIDQYLKHPDTRAAVAKAAPAPTA